MKTDDLIAVLATHATPARHDMVSRRFALALAWGVPAAALLLALTFGFRCPRLGNATGYEVLDNLVREFVPARG